MIAQQDKDTAATHACHVSQHSFFPPWSHPPPSKLRCWWSTTGGRCQRIWRRSRRCRAWATRRPGEPHRAALHLRSWAPADWAAVHVQGGVHSCWHACWESSRVPRWQCRAANHCNQQLLLIVHPALSIACFSVHCLLLCPLPASHHTNHIPLPPSPTLAQRGDVPGVWPSRLPSGHPHPPPGAALGPYRWQERGADGVGPQGAVPGGAVEGAAPAGEPGAGLAGREATPNTSCLQRWAVPINLSWPAVATVCRRATSLTWLDGVLRRSISLTRALAPRPPRQIIFFGREKCPAQRHDPVTCPICSWAAVPPYDKAGNSPMKANGKKTGGSPSPKRPAAKGKASGKSAAAAALGDKKRMAAASAAAPKRTRRSASVDE